MLTARRQPIGRQPAGRQPAGRQRRRWWARGLTVAVLAATVPTALAAAMPAAFLGVAPARADIVRSTQDWVLSELRLPAAWSVTEGKGVVVAVIDSGVNPSVSDLSGSVRTGADFTGVATPSSDPNWGVHGTWMASLIAGHGHGGGNSGILGSAPQSTVLSIRVITDASDPNNAKYTAQSGGRGQRELADAVTYAVDHGAQVISMSLGYNLQSRPVRAALQDAYEHNVVVVASAGNSGNAAGAAGRGQAPYSFPADYPGVLAVGAVNSRGQVSSFSSENLSVQVAAPGVRVPAQGRDGGYWYVSGTSPACALTAGVVALIKAKYPHLSDAQVISAITSSTTRSTRPRGGWDEQIGFGVVNATAALTAARHLAAESAPGVGVAPVAHFGGGTAAIPPVPVAPRGSTGLLLYCLLAAAGLGLVALATSRLLSVSDEQESDRPATLAPSTVASSALGRNGVAGPLASSESQSPEPRSPDPRHPQTSYPAAIPQAGPTAARHAAPRGRGHHPSGS